MDIAGFKFFLLRNAFMTKHYVTKAQFKHQTLQVPNIMLIHKIYCSCSLALDSAHVKFDV